MAKSIQLIYPEERTTPMIDRVITAFKRKFGVMNFEAVSASEIDLSHIHACRVLIVIIDCDWVRNLRQLSALHPLLQGIEIALKESKLIIPLCIDGASVPMESDLPLEIREMVSQQSVSLHETPTSFTLDMRKVFDQIPIQTNILQVIRWRSLGIAYFYAISAIFACLIFLFPLELITRNAIITLITTPLLVGEILVVYGVATVQALVDRRWWWALGMGVFWSFIIIGIFEPSSSTASTNTTSSDNSASRFPENLILRLPLQIQQALLIVIIAYFFWQLISAVIRFESKYVRLSRYYLDASQATLSSSSAERKLITTSVFLSYRRAESYPELNPEVDIKIVCADLYKSLVQRLGEDQVFRDIDNVYAGTDFRKLLKWVLARSQTVIVLIGEHWLTVKDSDGRQRLWNPDDFVHQEVAAALAQKKYIVPVLVDDAEMPQLNQLPDDLRELAFCQPIQVKSGNKYDFDKVAAYIIREQNRRYLVFPWLVLGAFILTLGLSGALAQALYFKEYVNFELLLLPFICGCALLFSIYGFIISLRYHFIGWLVSFAFAISIMFGLTSSLLVFSSQLPKANKQSPLFSLLCFTIEFVLVISILLFEFGRGTIRITFEPKGQRDLR